MKRAATGGLLALAGFFLTAWNGTGVQSSVASIALSAASGVSAQATNVSGTWHGTITDPRGNQHEIELVPNAGGATVEGTISGGPPDGSKQTLRNGRIEGSKLTFEIAFKGPSGEDAVIRFEGDVTGDRARGMHGMAGMPMDLAWEATRVQGTVQRADASLAAGVSSASLDAAVRAEVVEALAQKLASGYAEAEAGEKMAKAVRSKLAAGAYDKILSPEEFARALHADVRAVVNDRHLRVTFDGARAASRSTGAAIGPDGRPPGMPDVRNGAIGRLQILPGNIGYIEVSGVPPGAQSAIDAAFAFLRTTDALIIDLRGNGGGSPDTVAYYMSYLSEGAPYTVIRVQNRQGDVRETKTTDLGERSYGAKKPVYLLTSKITFSGGEEFAYDVQAFKRGVIVGETTGGGANPGGPQSLGHGFTVFVPTGLVKHPVTGTGWEGVGVKPDVSVAPALALLEAHRLAAESLAASVSDAGQSEMLRAIAAGLVEQQKIASAASSAPSTKIRAQLVGRYTPVGGAGPSYSVIEKEGHLVLQSSSPRPPSRLEPVSAGTFHLVGLPDDFTATFTTGSGGTRRLLLQQSNALPPLLLEQQ